MHYLFILFYFFHPLEGKSVLLAKSVLETWFLCNKEQQRHSSSEKNREQYRWHGSVQRMASSLSLLCYSSAASLVKENQHVIKIWEDTTNTQTRVTPLQLSQRRATAHMKQKGSLVFSVSSWQHNSYWKKPPNNKHCLASSLFFTYNSWHREEIGKRQKQSLFR